MDRLFYLTTLLVTVKYFVVCQDGDLYIRELESFAQMAYSEFQSFLNL